MELVGTLPLTAINLGLGASVAGLNAEVTKLQADASDLSPAVQASIEVSADFPPNPTSFAALIGAGLSVPELAAVLSPAGFTVSAADPSVDVAVKLGFIETQLGIVAGIRTQLEAGLDAGGISGWSFAGRAALFGPTLDALIRNGFGKLGPGDPVQGIVIVTQALESWNAFSESMNVAPAPPTTPRITAHGERSAANWNTGTARLFAELRAFENELEGMKAGLEADARIAIGLGLPDPTIIVEAGAEIFANIGIDGIMSDMVNVRADVGGTIGAIQADVNATLALIADVNAQLAAGGFVVYSYNGRADRLGAELTTALQGGLPGGFGPNAVVYGLALAGSPPAMSVFGGIFKTA